MKSIFTFILITCFIQFLIAQSTFVKVIDLNNHSWDNSIGYTTQGDEQIVISKSCERNCISLSKLNKHDSVSFYQEIDVTISDDPYIIDNDTIVIFGDNSYNDIYSKLIYKQTLSGDFIYQKSWSDPLNRAISIDHEGSIQLNESYISIGSFFDRDKFELGEYKTKGYVAFLDRDGSLDTFMVFDNFHYVRFRDVDLDVEGKLTLRADIIDSSLPDGYQDCIWIIKLDDKKNVIWEWKSVGQLSTPDPGLIKCTEDGNILLQNYQKRRGPGFAQTVELLKQNKEIEWGQFKPWSLNNRYIYHVKPLKDEVLISGAFTEINIFPTLYTSKIKKEKLIWERKYINYHSKDKDIQFTPQSKAGILDVKIYDNNLLFIGSKSLNFNSVDSNIKEEFDVVIIQTDTFGCVDTDKCNDYYAWGNVPDGLFQYDQIDMRQKEWYYAKTSNKGITETIHLTFGQDSIIFDRLWGDRQYKEVLVSDVNKKNTILDTLFVRWENTGKLFFIDKWEPKDGVVSPADSILYDFTLEVDHKFLLPHGFGFATVEKVDSISLLDGYKRKRLTLKHDNIQNQNKYDDLIWIEGIGAENGLFYFNDWVNNTKTSLNCYYDRNHKRWGEKDDCYTKSLSLTSVKYVSTANEWIQIYNNPIEPIPNYANRVKFSEDSIMWSGKFYRKMLVSQTEFGNEFKENGRIFREENGSVYEGIDVSPGEFLIYDFQLNVGDTTKVLLGSQLKEMICIGSDTIVYLDGIKRKRQVMQCNESDKNYIWVEGFGEPELYHEYCDDENKAGFISCYFYNDMISYTNPIVPGCWTVATEDIANTNFKIIPSPASNDIQIIGEIDFDKVTIYHISGQKVLNSGTKFIDISTLYNGLYILEILKDNKVVSRQKFVKLE
jgi:hypothetical protein